MSSQSFEGKMNFFRLLGDRFLKWLSSFGQNDATIETVRSEQAKKIQAFLEKETRLKRKLDDLDESSPMHPYMETGANYRCVAVLRNRNQSAVEIEAEILKNV
jgi:hypothetical protein